MNKPKHVVVYSHGFGVRKDDRGLLSDTAESMPEKTHILFDYNYYDNATKTLTVRTLTDQVDKLNDVVARVEEQYPGANVDMVAHSQGCIVAALAHPAIVQKAIFLAPPDNLNMERIINMFANREGAVIDLTHNSRLPRRDGTTTLVPADYWESIKTPQPIRLYERFSQTAKIIIVKAMNDEVLGDCDFYELADKVEIIPLKSNHDFTGEARQKAVALVKQLINA